MAAKAGPAEPGLDTVQRYCPARDRKARGHCQRQRISTACRWPQRPNIGLLNLQGSFELRAFFRGKPRFAIRLCREPGRRHLYAERHVAIDAAAHLQLQLARAFARRHEPLKAQQRD